MNKTRAAELRRILLVNQEKTLASIRQRVHDFKEKGSSTARRLENSIDAFGAYCDIPETDVDLEVSLAQIENNKLTLVNEALKRFESGQYGNCSDCGKEISETRLNALPFAIRCKDCEELREKSA